MDLTGFIPSFGGFFFSAGAFIIALSVIVAIHEYGHYIVGRWCGIHAEVFSIGFGKVIWSRVDQRGTRWQIAALPFGGYVKFLGDANAASAGADEETMAKLGPDERRHTMHGAPLWARAATVVAGPVFNFLLSIAIFSVMFMLSGAPAENPIIGSLKTLPGGNGALMVGDEILGVEGVETASWKELGDQVKTLPSKDTLSYLVRRDGEEITADGPFLFPAYVEGVMPGSAAMDAGLQKADVIVAANGYPTNRFADLVAVVDGADGAPIALSVWRAGQVRDVTLAPRRTDQPTAEGGFESSFKIGVIGDFFFTPATREVGPVEAVSAAGKQTWRIITTSVSGISHMLTGAISTCNISGPFAIAEASGQAASQGLGDLISLIALLSTAIGFMNLLPIPVLDGGHLVFHAYEWATGRPLPDRVLNVAMALGLAIVLSLLVFGVTNDLFCP
ncbi:MAG: RIP metalloprotease RseP [Albidovulum sp.]